MALLFFCPEDRKSLRGTPFLPWYFRSTSALFALLLSRITVSPLCQSPVRMKLVGHFFVNNHERPSVRRQPQLFAITVF